MTLLRFWVDLCTFSPLAQGTGPSCHFHDGDRRSKINACRLYSVSSAQINHEINSHNIFFSWARNSKSKSLCKWRHNVLILSQNIPFSSVVRVSRQMQSIFLVPLCSQAPQRGARPLKVHWAHLWLAALATLCYKSRDKLEYGIESRTKLSSLMPPGDFMLQASTEIWRR